MNRFSQTLLMLAVILSPIGVIAQCVGNGGYEEDGDEYPCGGGNGCCTNPLACNAPCYNFDPDYAADGGCDMSCVPIDSEVWFLLIGGAVFGGFMLNRRRELELIAEEVKN